MKALTICQPYAHLICLPDDDDLAKRVENRTWPTSYRGPLLIHAGKSRQWLSGGNYGIPIESMVFGAIVGIAELIDCCQRVPDGFYGAKWPDGGLRRHPWLGTHLHAEGPWCFVLARVRRFERPIPYRGAQGFFNVPKEVIEPSFSGT